MITDYLKTMRNFRTKYRFSLFRAIKNFISSISDSQLIFDI